LTGVVEAGVRDWFAGETVFRGELTVVRCEAVLDLARVYARHARDFDRLRTRSLMELPYLERATSIAPPPGKVLDVGCGSGEPIARYFVESGYEVTGIDFVDEMLAMCKSRFPQMIWRSMDMRELDFRDQFSVVIAWDSFFHLSPDDQRLMLPRFSRHTAAGGVLIFTSGTTEGGAIGGDLCGDRLYHGSLNTDEYAQLLDRHGYDVVLHKVEDPDCGGHTVWIARRRQVHV
jgi:ubiquinone/menaquinone biosynthesis C-methylase UbiE